MKNNICFLGDSIVEHGHYIYALRSYLRNKKTGVAIYNCGLGGMRADMVTEALIESELKPFQPQYCVISFGVNDLGIWLYDSYLQTTKEVIKQRKMREETYRKGIKNTIRLLRENGITPVLLSPYPVNELLEEKPDIPTVGDNAEKAQLINPWFYKRQTFRKINGGLVGLNSILREIAREEKIKFIDIFSLLRTYTLEREGLFNADGIHYSRFGGEYIARSIIEAVEGDETDIRFSQDEENDEIYVIEREDRAISFLRFCEFQGKGLNALSKKRKKEHIEKLRDDASTEEWLKRYCQIYLKNFEDLRQPKKKVMQLTEAYLFEE